MATTVPRFGVTLPQRGVFFGVTTVFTPPLVEAWTAAGSAAEHVEHLRALGRDRAKRIALRITSWQQEEQFARLVNEVLPKV
jgi:hypothetical protein